MTATVLPKEPGTGLADRADKGNDEGHIRCPLCKWRPQAWNRWMCKCRHIWHTFDTGGVCPKSLYQWQITQCLSCRRVSLHSDWYPKGRGSIAG
jgi:hypothetical protein